LYWWALGYEPIIGSLRTPSNISWRLSLVEDAILRQKNVPIENGKKERQWVNEALDW